MRIVTFEEFIKDYNKHYNCDVRAIRSNTHDIEQIVDEVYNNCDFEIDYEKEVIEIY